MPPQLRGRQAIFLVVPPMDWKPQRLWDVPPQFSQGVLHARNLPMRDCLGFARSHNKAAVQKQQQDGRPIRQWAVVFRHLRPNWHKRIAQAAGGAA